MTEWGQLETTVDERVRRLRDRAEQLRILAGSMKSQHARLTLLCLAEDYEKLSQHAQRSIAVEESFRAAV